MLQEMQPIFEENFGEKNRVVLVGEALPIHIKCEIKFRKSYGTRHENRMDWQHL